MNSSARPEVAPWWWLLPAHFFYLPIILLCFYFSPHYFEASFITRLGLFAAGIFIWTFLEYLIHRFLFHGFFAHSQSQSIVVKEWYNHYIHHNDTHKIEDVVTQVRFSIPFTITFAAIIFLVSRNVGITLAIIPGILAGFLYYEWVHFAAHFYAPKMPWASWQSQNHLRHHFQDDHRRYGVTSPFWDIIFRTF